MTDKGSKLLDKEKDSFFHGPGMQKNWVIVNQKCLDYAGSKHGQSAKATLIAGKLVVTEIDSSVLKRFKTKDEQEKCFNSLEFWQQEECTAAKDDYQKFSRIVRAHLSGAYGDLFAAHGVPMHDRLEAEPDHRDMVENGGCNATMLHKLVKKIFNGSASCTAADDVLGNILESLHNCALTRGDYCPNLAKCLEAAKQRMDALKQAGFDIAGDSLRDSHMAEMESRDQDMTALHRHLNSWKTAPKGGTTDDAIKDGKEALTDAIMARVCARQSGQSFEQCRSQLHNGCADGDKEHPIAVTEANRRMECHRPIKLYRKNEGSDAQHGQSGKVKPKTDDRGEIEGDQNTRIRRSIPISSVKGFVQSVKGPRSVLILLKRMALQQTHLKWLIKSLKS